MATNIHRREITAMRSLPRAARYKLLGNLLCLAAMPAFASPAPAPPAYLPINPTMNSQTVALTGHDLGIEQIVMVARYGAKVELSAEASAREADNYGLLLEASAEGIPVYWFNRGVGQQRETVLFEGDPMSAQNRPLIERIQGERFRDGAASGVGPEIDAEEIVRAMMLVRANEMVYDAPSPQLAQMLLELLNRRVTPVVQSRGTLGEADLAQLSNVGQTMVGVGEAYLAGVRMSAEQALRRAGLTPLRPFAADDNALTSSNAYATAQAALLVHDAEAALDWADLIYAMDLDGMNSSITPLSRGVQRARPEPWLNWHAARTLDMLRGSYLFEADPHRIIQDPESLRASSIRQASAWEQWSALRQSVVFQANSSDHNPAVSVGLGPEDSWELSTPQMMRYYVRGGPHSHGQHGYIVSNANWDPYPMANQVESFVIALANMDIAVMLRIERFKNPFFTGVAAASVLPKADEDQYDYNPVDLQQEVQSLMTPLAPMGSAIVGTVEDLQSQTRVKLQRARQAVAVTMDLLAFDLLEGTLWMDVRAAQDPQRNFGAAPTAAWAAFHRLGAGPSPSLPTAAQFLRTTPATTFYQGPLAPFCNCP
jgi:histidine ammonia-lyase